MSALTFTPGKFYRTRDGRKARIYATDGVIPFCLQGAIETPHGSVTCEWANCGRYTLGGDNDHDLIAEWSDAPEIDWSKMPEGANHVTIDKDGAAFAWEFRPNREEREWWPAHGRYWELYPQHVPKWSGDWRDSLVTREGAQP